MRVQTFSIGANQDPALVRLAELMQKGQENPRVIALARQIVNDCPSRDDICELQSLYDAVKHGDSRTVALAKGMKYRSDPRSMDFFSSADRIIKMCEHGACGSDCDEHTVLIGSLAGAIGFTVGARAYGRETDQGAPYVHVYAVAMVPKGSIPKGLNGLSSFGSTGKEFGLDTTVESADLGWQPKPGHYRTAWVTEEA